MRIRQADPARDAAGCAAVYEPYVRDTAISFEEHPPDAAEMRARIERFSKRHPWLVAEEDGALIGYAYASPHRERAAYRWTADVAVYVSAERHQQGVGRALYEALLDLLVKQGIRIACAGITLPNQASVALHQRLGFEPVGVYRRIGWKAGAWRDVAWYQRELLPEGPDPPPEPRRPAGG